jgi:hypothetical protein
MHGGTYRANSIENTSWGVGVADEKTFDVLSVGAGLNYISMVAVGGNGGGKPINAITAKTLAQTDKGTLVVYDPSCNSAPASTVTNSMIRILDWANHVVGATGDPVATNVHPIIPWLLVNRNSDYSNVSFASFDESGRVVQSKWEDKEISTYSSASTNVNAYSTNKKITLSADVALQSLFLQNTSPAKTLGAGRTLTITSGGLVLHKARSAIGNPGTPGTNGKLVLGDATHPAYVWAKSYEGDPNQIWAETTAAGGFVKSWPGNLVLGGPQTNIAVEIVVNGGSLQLGTETKNCELAEGLPIRVCAGATLKLPFSGTIAKNPLKLDGSAGAFGMAELPVDQSCASLSIRDVFESDSWTELRAGTYGSSGSGAEIVRDDLFAGAGVLTVGGRVRPTAILTVW